MEKSIIKLRPHHCGISVPDIEASIAWYRDMLGFSVALRLTLGAASGTKIVFMKHGDFYMELFEVPGAAPLPESQRDMHQNLATHGTKHIAFMVDDLRQAVDILKQRGVDIVRDVSKEEKPRAAFIRDNSGILIELVPPSAPE